MSTNLNLEPITRQQQIVPSTSTRKGNAGSFKLGKFLKREGRFA